MSSFTGVSGSKIMQLFVHDRQESNKLTTLTGKIDVL